ncbi:hypothetical protein [Paraglaciecola sp. MB-3u-78]|uniref:hypothetical protein n=1 Tax=Paraglaciecola sp. MB-3u-78 TaxID=2058332 RepID=UPI000C334BE0|nr:hypothetical protein [Paraglaciecola sp. MB-3u-78]PKG97143.1 hypothetical protein CXF95_21325 [Paraglaciecola sp. MB-3u-78]
MQATPSVKERKPLIRQAIIFQLKLGLDALRDILMSPVSIILVITDIVMANNHQQSYFIRLMRLGKKSDHWINLFGVELANTEDQDNEVASDSNVDDWFTKIEEVIKEQQVDGKLSQSGKEKLQKYFRRINQSTDKPKGKEE